MAQGRPRTHNHAAIVAYAAEHPELKQSEVAKQFGVTQSQVSLILRVSGIRADRHQRRGRTTPRKREQTELEHKWELILHRAGLGMNRGLSLHKQRIYYGYDSRYTTIDDRSATLTATGPLYGAL